MQKMFSFNINSIKHEVVGVYILFGFKLLAIEWLIIYSPRNRHYIGLETNASHTLYSIQILSSVISCVINVQFVVCFQAESSRCRLGRHQQRCVVTTTTTSVHDGLVGRHHRGAEPDDRGQVSRVHGQHWQGAQEFRVLERVGRSYIGTRQIEQGEWASNIVYVCCWMASPFGGGASRW